MAENKRQEVSIRLRLTLPMGVRRGGLEGVRPTLIYKCRQGYEHSQEGELLSEAGRVKVAFICTVDEDCLHCPDCGCEVDPGFEACGGFADA